MNQNQTPYKQNRNVNKGRVVIYRVPAADFSSVAYERPAIVVRAWSDEMLQLAVLCDGGNDAHDIQPTSTVLGDVARWATSVHYSVEPKPHTWCWCDEQDLSPEGQAR